MFGRGVTTLCFDTMGAFHDSDKQYPQCSFNSGFGSNERSNTNLKRIVEIVAFFLEG